jgi:hypothetical protein
MNAEMTASHITAVMKIATTQAGPRRRYVMQMANQKAKPDLDFPFVNQRSEQPARRRLCCRAETGHLQWLSLSRSD